jgi:long-chain acyl-CoA synthetase
VAVQQAASPEGRRALTDSLAGHLKTVNETLDRHEQMDCLVLTTEPWTVDNELITPTFKVRRNSVEAVFGTHFERWTASGETVVWHQG